MLAELQRQCASTPFLHRGALYLMGAGGRGMHVVIRRPRDGGRTWTKPTDSGSGLLRSDVKHHGAPTPVVIARGRIWRAMEDCRAEGGWPAQYRAFMLSAPVEADLLDAANWAASNRVASDRAWLDGELQGWLEGNAVVALTGDVVNILRAETWGTGSSSCWRARV